MDNKIIILGDRKPWYSKLCRILLVLFVLVRISFLVLNVTGLYFSADIMPQYILMLLIDFCILISAVFSIKLKSKVVRTVLLVIACIIMTVLATTLANLEGGRKIFTVSNEEKTVSIVAVEQKSIFSADTEFFIKKGILMKKTDAVVSVQYDYYYIFDHHEAFFTEDVCTLRYRSDSDAQYKEIQIPLK